LANKLDIPSLTLNLTHVWRATLVSEYASLAARGQCSLDDTTRAELFGRTEGVERDFYLAGVTPEEILALVVRPRVALKGEQAHEVIPFQMAA
jgi:hypothetical protein